MLDAGTDGTRKHRALDKLCRTYWRPVYGFIRRLGNEAEHAKDLTQAFFAHLLDLDILTTANPAREFRGEDQQLDKAIEVILQELKTKGQTLPPPPAWPDKS